MSHPVNQLFYVLGVLFLFLILMEAINLIAIQPRARKTVATVTKIRLRSAEDSRHAGPFSGKQKEKRIWPMLPIVWMAAVIFPIGKSRSLPIRISAARSPYGMPFFFRIP